MNFILLAIKYVSADCVYEGYDGSFQVVKCTNILLQNIAEEITKYEGFNLRLTLVDTDFYKIH